MSCLRWLREKGVAAFQYRNEIEGKKTNDETSDRLNRAEDKGNELET